MNLKSILIFLVGAATGVVASYKFLDTKLKKQYKENLESFKEAYKKSHPEPENDIPEEKDTDEGWELTREEKIRVAAENSLLKYRRERDEKEHVNYSKTPEPEAPKESVREPYIIQSNEFGYDKDYTSIGLIYDCKKNLLIDEETHQKLTSLEEIVGVDCTKYINDICNEPGLNGYPLEDVYVRDELTMTEYEITITKVEDYDE